jgi:hypothetical protein
VQGRPHARGSFGSLAGGAGLRDAVGGAGLSVGLGGDGAGSGSGSWSWSACHAAPRARLP